MASLLSVRGDIILLQYINTVDSVQHACTFIAVVISHNNAKAIITDNENSCSDL